MRCRWERRPRSRRHGQVTFVPWWTVDQTARVHWSGLYNTNFTTDEALAKTGTVSTYLSTDFPIQQDGYIRRVVMGAGAGGTGQFSVFRYSGAGIAYDCISVSESRTFTSGVQTYNLATPMACKEWDYLAVTVQTTSTVNARDGSYTTLRSDNPPDPLNSLSFGDGTGAYTLCAEGFGYPPFLCGAGNSIMAGHSSWSPPFEGAAHTDRLNDFLYQTALLADSDFQFQNFGISSRSFAQSFGLATYFNQAAPRAVVILAGASDVVGGSSATDIRDAIATGSASVTPGIKLVVCEIPPSNAPSGGLYSDAQSAVVRSANALIQTWCAANSALCVVCHDALASTRVSTGQLDDANPAYFVDGIHLNDTGAALVGGLLYSTLNAYFRLS